MTSCTTATLSASATLLILSTGVASHAVRTTARSPGVTAVRGAALRPAYAPPLQRAARVPCPPRMASESAGESPVARARAWFGKWMKFDRASLSKLGVDAFFTYGLVSNLNAGAARLPRHPRHSEPMIRACHSRDALRDVPGRAPPMCTRVSPLAALPSLARQA